MDSIKTIYRIGNGPSSSHTMGPQKAASIFKSKNPDADKYIVELYGALAETGRGHLTDFIILKTLGINSTTVKFMPEVIYDYHPNGMRFIAIKNEIEVDSWLVFSVGGGELKELNEVRSDSVREVYKEKNMYEILQYCDNNNLSLYEYIIQKDDKDILKYMDNILDVMFASVERGLNATGVLPGRLKIEKRANKMYSEYLKSPNATSLEFASSLAASEENASGGMIVIAPTCGSCGVVAGALYTYNRYYNVCKEKIIEGLLVGGLIGNIVKQNASISGAEVGCQGEVGVACAMAAAAVCHIKGGNNKQIEYASEIALEHHLGLTCDPVEGYVQIPCIERNAMSAKRAIDCALFALLTNGEHYIKLDDAIKTMLETGKDLNPEYKETSKAGLAKRMEC